MAPSLRKTYVIGVGLTAFQKPRGLIDYPEMAVEAVTKALLEAGLTYDAVESAFAGYVYGDSTCGQRALYELGMTGIPIVNVNNNCSTGSTAVFLARQNIAVGLNECALAVGFEKMQAGSLAATYTDRQDPMGRSYALMKDINPTNHGPMAAQLFGNGAEEYCQLYGSTWKHVAAISAKNHQHSVHNPYAQFRNPMTPEEVLADRKITDKITRGMCCPTSDGAGACLIASEDFVHKHGLENQAIEIVAQSLTTDSTDLFAKKSAIELTGADMTRRAAQEAYRQARIGPEDIQVIELHDCFAANELLVYDGLGLAPSGKAHTIVDSGDFTYGGKFVINPSGGLESKGHPLGATGPGMIFYLCHQLRGWAGPMQAERATPGYMEARGKDAYALAHNLGLGGAAVVTILKRPSFWKATGIDGRSRMGYNHAVECRKVSQEDIDRVKSRKAFSAFARA